MSPHLGRPTWPTVAALLVAAFAASVLVATGQEVGAEALAVLAVLAGIVAPMLWCGPRELAPAVELVDAGSTIVLGHDCVAATLARGVYREPAARQVRRPLGLSWVAQRTVRLTRPLYVAPVASAPAARAWDDPTTALRPWEPGEHPGRLALAASARSGTLVVRGPAHATAERPSTLDVHLDREDDAAPALGVILDDLRSGTVTVRTLRAGAVVTDRIGSRDAARRVMAAAEVGPWPI